MSEIAELSQLTLDEFVVKLISGQPVSIAGQEAPYSLLHKDSQVALSYYNKKRELWDSKKNVSQQEVSTLYAAIEASALPAISITATATKARKVWNLKRVEAFRFGGLHRHCDHATGAAPEVFIWHIEHPLTLVRGFNGAGKTSLMNAIVWALTGFAYRSQTPPSNVDQPVPLSPSTQTDEDVKVKFSVPPIVPIPGHKELAVLGDQIKIDTWVALILVSEDGAEVVVKRQLRVSGKDKYSTVVTGLDGLDIPSLCLQIGTVMPGVLSHMRIGEKSNLGEVIALLTGLQPAEELGKRCDKIIESWLKLSERKAIEQEKKNQITQFELVSGQYEKLLTDNPQLKPNTSLVKLELEKDCISVEKSLTGIRDEHSKALVKMSEGVEFLLKKVLSEPEIKALPSVVTKALSLLDPSAIQKLSGIQKSSRLKDVYENIKSIEEIIKSILHESEKIADDAQKPAIAARRRLYARVADWHRVEHGEDEISVCPVCSSDLSKVPPDSLLNLSVKKALELALQADAKVSQTISEWQDEQSKGLSDKLPTGVRDLLDSTLPETPLFYFDEAINELLKESPFSDALKDLSVSALSIWTEQRKSLPNFSKPDDISINKPFNASHKLWTRLNNLQAVIAFARYRNEHETVLRAALNITLSFRKAEAGSVADKEMSTDLGTAPLKAKLLFLQDFCNNSSPLRSAVEFIDSLSKIVVARKESDKRDSLRLRTISALEPLAALPALIKTQVRGLLAELQARTAYWLKLIYRVHYISAPEFERIQQQEGGKLLIDSSVDGTLVPAEAILNSAAIRAALWALLFSLWERIFKDLGGLTLFILDDPQVQLDPTNVKNFAGTTPLLVGIGMRPLVTSNDHIFLETIKVATRAHKAEFQYSDCEISPITSSKICASVLNSIALVTQRRMAWREDKNSTEKAVAFIKEVRVFIEERLWGLLADDTIVQHEPTLSELMDRLSSLRKWQEPFREPLFGKVIDNPRLRSPHRFYRVINDAHHKNSAQLTPADAVDIDASLDEILPAIDDCWVAYLRYMRRLAPEDIPDSSKQVPQPAVFNVPTNVLPILGKLAAKSLASVPVDVGGDDENISLPDLLGEVALYSIRSDTLGAACWPGQTAVVSLSAEPINGDLVVCVTENSVYARRLIIADNDYKNIILQPEAGYSGHAPKTISVIKAEVRLLKIVGVLFDAYEKIYGSGEAVLVDKSISLQSAKAIVKVSGDSASPVANDGQKVLISPLEDMSLLGKMKGQIVGVATSDNEAYLKRVGPLTANGQLILEKIGLNGETVVVSLESEDGMGTKVNNLLSVAKVHGVLY